MSLHWFKILTSPFSSLIDIKCWQASVAERASVAKHLFFFLHSSSFCDFFSETGFKSSAKQSALDFVALHCPSIWWLFLSNWFQIFLFDNLWYFVVLHSSFIPIWWLFLPNWFQIFLFDNLWDFVVSHSSFTHLDCRSLFTDPADSFENQIPTKNVRFSLFKTDLQRIHSSWKSQKEIGRQNLEKLTTSINKAYQQKNVRKKTPKRMIDDDVWDAEWIVNRVSTSFEWVTSETDLSQNYTPAGRCTI